MSLRRDAPSAGPAWRVVAWLMVAVYVTGIVAVAWLDHNISAYPPDSLLESVLLALAFGWFVLIGALVVSRQPRNPMGWVLAAVGLPVAVLAAGNYLAAYLVLERGYEPSLAMSLIAWPNNWSWFVTLGLVFIYLPLLFPDGRLPSRRWRLVAWIGAVGVGGICILGGLASDVGFQVSMTPAGPEASIPNPFGIPGLDHPEQHPIGSLFFGLFGVASLGAFASLVVRFRRSRGVERQQLKWLVLAVALLPLSVLLEAIGGGIAERIEGIGFLAGFNLIPLTIGVAILRYRLYELDRIVSRTVSYVLLTVVLGGVYVAGVVGIGGLVRGMSGGAGGDLVVAATTLVIAALFQPARRRIQRVVDRRFNRARYDAQKTVETFAQRLRDDVDLEVLRTDLLAAVGETMRPRSVDLWTPGVPEGVAR
jgi:hypothetical protein